MRAADNPEFGERYNIEGWARVGAGGSDTAEDSWDISSGSLKASLAVFPSVGGLSYAKQKL